MAYDLPLVPAPRRSSLFDGPGHPLTAATVLSGQLAGLLRDELLLATGVSPALGDGGSVRLLVDGHGSSESYRIRVRDDAVEVSAADPDGLRHAVSTLVQAARRGPDGWGWPALDIDDEPRFRYRGLMLDVARRFYDPTAVKSIIDRAARLKLNVVHLHLSDDQGWRLEIASRPELIRSASSSAALDGRGGYYTQADFAGIIEHAAARGVTVVPEIDLPGHTHAVGVAYPDLAEPPVISDEMREVVARFGGALPVAGRPCDCIAVGFSSLRIHHEPTYAFLRDVLGEVAAMTPGPWLHVGGDECLGTDAADFAYFMQRVSELVIDLGKTPVAWHEAGAAPGLAEGTVGQYWGLRDPSPETAAKARSFIERGGKLVLSPADAVYLDMKYDENTPLGLEWARPVDLRKSYEWDPATLIPGVAESDLLGVEAALWTETIGTLEQFDEMAYPRLAAAAEAAWTPSDSPARGWESFARRVGGLAAQWHAQGIGFHRSPGVEWPPVDGAGA